MRDRLDQYTMAQFIDIACGDYTAIGAEPEEAKKTAESLITQYNDMADPAASKANIVEAEKICRSDAKIKLFMILLYLIHVYKAYEDVRELLNDVHMTNVSSMDDERMTGKLEQLLRSEEALQERRRKEKDGLLGKTLPKGDIRASFDQQTARLMAHFKFAINHETISASVYANLVNMACRQQRQQLAQKQ